MGSLWRELVGPHWRKRKALRMWPAPPASDSSTTVLKELLPMLPLMYIKAVLVQPHWIADGVGFLRNDPAVYECPVYTTQARGGTYVFLATLNTRDPVSKWVMTGTAIIMQTA